jgi:hypothetical protein
MEVTLGVRHRGFIEHGRPEAGMPNIDDLESLDETSGPSAIRQMLPTFVRPQGPDCGALPPLLGPSSARPLRALSGIGVCHRGYASASTRAPDLNTSRPRFQDDDRGLRRAACCVGVQVLVDLSPP